MPESRRSQRRHGRWRAGDAVSESGTPVRRDGRGPGAYEEAGDVAS